MWLTYLQIALRVLRANLFRSTLTVASIVIGAFSIVLMTSLAESGFGTLSRSFEELGGTSKGSHAIGRHAEHSQFIRIETLHVRADRMDMRPVDLARQACRDLGIEPFDKPIRGGTDGSRLTELGVPTPNLFTGMQDVHGPLEWISLQDMASATAVCLRLAHLWSAAA